MPNEQTCYLVTIAGRSLCSKYRGTVKVFAKNEDEARKTAMKQAIFPRTKHFVWGAGMFFVESVEEVKQHDE